LLVVVVELQEQLVVQVQHLLLVQQTDRVLDKVVLVVLVLVVMLKFQLDLVEVVMDGLVL
jgi:hypothetical protein